MSSEENRPAGRARGFRAPLWLAGLLGAVALVVVGGAVTLKLLFPPEKLRALVEPQLEARVGREVELGSVRLRVFPRIAVRLGELSIANPPGFSAEPALQLEALELQLRFWPLLHKQFELGQVRLVRPVFRYELLADGTTNFDGLGSTGAEGAPSATAVDPAGGSSAIAAAGLVVEDLILKDGTIIYLDRRSGRGARMSVDARLNAERASEGSTALLSRGRIDLRSIQALIPELGGDSTALPDVGLEYEVFADLPGDSLVLRELRVDVGDVRLEGGGAVRGLRSARTIDFALETGELDIAELLASLPPALQPEGVDASGRAQLALRIAGPVGEGLTPEINGTLQLESVGAAYGEYGRVLSDGSGQISFDIGSLSLSRFEGLLWDRPFELALNVTDFEAPIVNGRVRGDLDLGRLAELRERPMPVEGNAAIDISFSGPAKEPAGMRLTGSVRLSDVSYQSPSLAVPARISSATLQLTGTGVRAEAVPIELGGSDLTLSLSSQRLLQYALSRDSGGPIPFVEFTVKSNRLDMAELSVQTGTVGYSDLVKARLAGRDLDGRDPGESARERYPQPALPPVNASGRVEIAELLNPPTRARDVSFNIVAKNGVIDVTDLQGEVYGGQLSGGLSLDFSQGRPPYTLRYDLKIRDAEAGVFLQRWTRLGQALSGMVDFDISGSSAIDETMLPTPGAVDAMGQANFREGKFQDFGITRALASQFKLDPSHLSGFQQLGGAFEIKGGSILVDGWDFSSRDIKGLISGSAGLGGSLDLQLGIELPASTLQKAGLVQRGGVLGDLAGQLAGDDEAIQVAIGIGGTMSHPTLEIDSEALQKELAKRLEDAGKNLLKKIFKPPN